MKRAKSIDQPTTLREIRRETREIETVVFSRRPVIGDLLRVVKTQTIFGPQMPIMADDALERVTTIDVLADDARERAIAQLELEIPLLSDPDFRRWLSIVAKKIGSDVGAPVVIKREDGAKLIALVRCAVGLDDLLRALDKKDPKQIRRLRALYAKRGKVK